MSKIAKFLLNEEGQSGKTAIIQLASKAFATRNALHLEHWNTRSYAAHMALGELYDEIIDDIDEIVETFQGKYGLIGMFNVEAIQMPVDIITRVTEEADWVEANRDAISNNDPAIGNLVDTLLGHYRKTVYKLTNLK